MTDSGPDNKRRAATKPRRGGLGRGLDALIPTSPGPGSGDNGSPVAAAATEVSIDAISPNPYQPRSSMDRARLEELATSIRTHGLMQPLVVTRGDAADRYVLIAGERRWRASRMAGLTTVPVVLKDAVPQTMLELALVENVIRADLSPLEEASAYRQLIDEFGLSQAEIAERVGRSRVSITNTMRLLNAPDRIQHALAAHQITEGHARALLGLTTATDQVAALDMVLERGLNVRQTEDLVRRWLTDAPKSADSSKAPDPDALRLEERLRDALGTRVSFRRGAQGQGGTLTIQFFSDEQLQALYDRLIGEELW